MNGEWVYAETDLAPFHSMLLYWTGTVNPSEDWFWGIPDSLSTSTLGFLSIAARAKSEGQKDGWGNRPWWVCRGSPRRRCRGCPSCNPRCVSPPPGWQLGVWNPRSPRGGCSPSLDIGWGSCSRIRDSLAVDGISRTDALPLPPSPRSSIGCDSAAVSRWWKLRPAGSPFPDLQNPTESSSNGRKLPSVRTDFQPSPRSSDDRLTSWAFLITSMKIA